MGDAEPSNLKHANSYRNLREWIEQVDAMGELRRVSRAGAA